MGVHSKQLRRKVKGENSKLAVFSSLAHNRAYGNIARALQTSIFVVAFAENVRVCLLPSLDVACTFCSKKGRKT
jgi:hypothetical protein